jgi:hypothetical protein
MVLVGWLAACVPFALTALSDRDTIRYNFLALPALCICAGAALQWLMSRGPDVQVGTVRARSGVVVAAGLLMLAVLYAVGVWGNLIFNQYH